MAVSHATKGMVMRRPLAEPVLQVARPRCAVASPVVPDGRVGR